MKPFRSIRWRVQGWYGLLFLLVLAALGLTAFQFERSRRLKVVDDELLRRASLVAEAIRNSVPRGEGLRSGEKPRNDPPKEESVSTESANRRGNSTGRSGRGGPRGFFKSYIIGERIQFEPIVTGAFYSVEWIDRESTSLQASPGAPADVPVPDDRGTYLRTRGEWREVGFTPLPDHAFIIGRSLESDYAELGHLAWVLAAAGAALLLLAIFGGWWITGRALQPIHEISSAAERISEGNLAQRIDARDTESELGQLAVVLNSTFARLEAAFSQQARFTADAAHELRTPITVMLTHTQTALASASLTDAQREAFEACERAAQRMRRLTESLLKLARLDAGQEIIPHERVDLAKVVRDCVELVQPLAEARGISVHTELEPVTCFGHANLLGQVVTNLLANAIQHHDKAGKISVTTRSENDLARLIVADDGPGIAPEHLGHLFERFYRVDHARSSRSGGTGLGLAISKAIVIAHRGEIRVISEVSRGTTFTVELATQ